MEREGERKMEKQFILLIADGHDRRVETQCEQTFLYEPHRLLIDLI